MFELTPVLIYETFIIVIATAAIVAFSIFYFRLLKGYNKLRLDHEKLEKELDEYGNVIAASSKEHIQKLVAHSQELSDELKTQLASLLEQQAQKEAGAYSDVVAKIGKELSAESKEQVQEFAISLQKEVKETEEEVSGKISALYDTTATEVGKMHEDAQKEIEAMKAAVRTELEKHIYEIVQDVVKQSTGKLLSQEDHEGIVLEALQSSMQVHGLNQNV